MRHELHEKLGPPLTNFDQMEAWQEARLNKVTGNYREDQAYLIDDFSDLDWSQPIALTPELRKLRDQEGLVLPADLPT